MGRYIVLVGAALCVLAWALPLEVVVQVDGGVWDLVTHGVGLLVRGAFLLVGLLCVVIGAGVWRREVERSKQRDKRLNPGTG